MKASVNSPQPWERLPGETAKAHRAFSLYRALEPQARSISEAYRLYTGSETAAERLRKVPGYFYEWSTRHRWVIRAEAWDAHLEAERVDQERSDWLARQAELRENEWRAGSQLLERAQAILEWPMREERLDQDGHTVIVKPARWHLRDAGTLLGMASKLQRLASGLSTGHTEISGPGGQPLFEPEAALDLSSLTDDELETFRALLRKMRGGPPPKDE